MVYLTTSLSIGSAIDFTKRNGSGGESIYGNTFDDEDLSRELDSEGYAYRYNLYKRRS